MKYCSEQNFTLVFSVGCVLADRREDEAHGASGLH